MLALAEKQRFGVETKTSNPNFYTSTMNIHTYIQKKLKLLPFQPTIGIQECGFNDADNDDDDNDEHIISQFNRKY